MTQQLPGCFSLLAMSQKLPSSVSPCLESNFQHYLKANNRRKEMDTVNSVGGNCEPTNEGVSRKLAGTKRFRVTFGFAFR